MSLTSKLSQSFFGSEILGSSIQRETAVGTPVYQTIGFTNQVTHFIDPLLAVYFPLL